MPITYLTAVKCLHNKQLIVPVKHGAKRTPSRIFKHTARLAVLLVSLWGFGQKGPSREVMVGMNKSNVYNLDKTNGFEFSNVPFRYQFVNCGGDVQMGINYDRRANYSAFFMDGKKYYQSDIEKINSSYWPKPEQIELNTIGADLYFAGSFLGKVTLTYIVGNFAGCWGETFDVLAQVGKSAKEEIYKVNINDLTLKNVVVLYGGPTGGLVGKIESALKEQKKQEEINAKVQALLASANYQYSVSNFKEAKNLFEQAYRLQPNNQNIKNLIDQSESAIKQEAERIATEKAREAERAKEAETEQAASAHTATAASGSGGASNTGNTSNVSNGKTGGSSNTISSESGSESKKVETAPESKNTIGNTGKTYEELQYERRAAEAQQKARIKQAVNPGGYAMEQSGANAFYSNLLEKNRQEADARRQREEREWEEERRRERRRQLEEERRAEAYQKQQEEERLKYNLSLEEAYQKKGGDANFNQKLKEFENFAGSKLSYINSYLTQAGSAYQNLYYQDNCSYVNLIENIQYNQNLSPNIKLGLIEIVIGIKKAYVDFYRNNSKHGHDYSNRNFQDNTLNDGCSQYLLTVSGSLNLQTAIGFKWSTNIANTPKDFVNDYKSQVSSTLSNAIFEYYYKGRTSETYTDGILKFKLEDFLDFYLYKSWFQFGTSTYETEQSKRAPFLTDESRLNQINKIITTHDLRRKYHTAKIVDELTMAVFCYNHGLFEEALDYYKVYELKVADKEVAVLPKENAIANSSLNYESTITKLLGAVLSIEQQNYKEAQDYINKLRQTELPVLIRKAKQSKYYYDDDILLQAITKLENIILFNAGSFEKMYLPKDKSDLKKFDLKNTYNFLNYFNAGLMAEALHHLGNKELAKEIVITVENYLKKEHKFNIAYRGTKEDVEALQRMFKIYRPKAIEKVQYFVDNRYLLKVKKYADFASGNNYRLLDWWVYTGKKIIGTPLTKNEIDLSKESTWLTFKNRDLTTIPKESVNEILTEFLTIYHKGKLPANDTSKHFLNILVYAGILSGNFYEVMPAMVDLKNSYDNKNDILFDKLLVLMTSHKDDLDYNRFVSLEIRNKTWSNPKEYTNEAIDWFNNHSNDSIVKRELQAIVGYWAAYKYSHVLMPYLYSLL